MNLMWTRYGVVPRMGVDGDTPPYAKYSSYVIQYVCVRIYCILANYFYIYINFTYGIAPRKPRFDKS